MLTLDTAHSPAFCHMSFYPGYVWYRGLLVFTLLDPTSPVSWISQDFLEGSFGTDAIASVLNSPGTNTVLGPVIAETWCGVYVTTLPLHVTKVVTGVVILGQDWLLATRCRRRGEGSMEGWPGSWGNEDCAWFSCAYHPGELLYAFMHLPK